LPCPGSERTLGIRSAIEGKDHKHRDVVNNIDEMNCTQETEENYRKKTISSIKTIKSLHDKKEELKKYYRK